MALTYEDLTVPPPSPGPMDWNDEGVVILKNFIPEELMVAYEDCWIANNAVGTRESFTMTSPMGWSYCTPYRDHPEIADILSYGPLHEVMEGLVGEPVGTHLNLTGWNTTARNFHQDSYLNPEHVGDYYIAAWVSLGTIHPDSGPFQYVPGSHRWPQVTHKKILSALAPHERDHMWPKHSERLLTDLFENEIEKRDATIVDFLPDRGDVLLWHGRLLHRGSPAKVPGMERRGLIAHYSGINHRKDMGPAYRHNDGWLFPIDDPSRKK